MMVLYAVLQELKEEAIRVVNPWDYSTLYLSSAKTLWIVTLKFKTTIGFSRALIFWNVYSPDPGTYHYFLG